MHDDSILALAGAAWTAVEPIVFLKVRSDELVRGKHLSCRPCLVINTEAVLDKVIEGLGPVFRLAESLWRMSLY